MTTNPKLECTYCSRKYRSKFNLDRHITGCAFFSKSLKEQSDEAETDDITPSLSNMYRFIKELAVRITIIEAENLKLKQKLNKKTHLIDWLNNASTIKPTIYFDEWFHTRIIPNIPNVLDVVFNSNLINGINTLFNTEFDNCLGQTSPLPIRAFHQYNSALFIFQKNIADETGKWIKITATDLVPWFHTLCKQFVIDFNTHWCCKHANKLENDDTYKDLYIDYYYKILGNNTENAIIYNKIRLNIFHKIKENIASIY